MNDPVTTNLRLWALVDVAYTALVWTLVLVFVPWKFPAANLAVLAYATAVGASAWPLWHARRWGWRLAVLTSLLGLGLAVVVITGFVASWAFLRAIYGSFGLGASLVSLLLAATAFQVLGLHSALRLHALLRRGCRERFVQIQRWPRALWPFCLIVFALPALAGLGVHARFSLSPLPPLTPQQVAAAMTALRTAINTGQPHLPVGLTGVHPGVAPFTVTWLTPGQTTATVHGEGSDLAAAVKQAAQKLNAHAGAREGAHGRLLFERTVATGPLAAWPGFLSALAFDPGRDTVGVTGKDPGPVIALDEIWRADVYGKSALLPFLDEVRLGVSTDWIRTRLNADKDQPLKRLRKEVWIECAAGVCPVDRGTTPLPGAPDLQAAARAAGDYMLHHQRPDGSFDYVYLPYLNVALNTAYNLSRHAGAAYSLAGLYGLLRDTRLAGAAGHALGWLSGHIIDPCGASREFACVIESGNARLGPSALAAIAWLEYRRQTGSHAGDAILQRLIAFIRHMQKPDGDFHHLFVPTVDAIATRSPAAMFASEEAALALVMAGQELGDVDHMHAAERALDFLTEKKYDHFLGRFTFGVDSWTCIAANAAWPDLQHQRYLDFCLGYADFLRRLQFRPGEADSHDFAGHYGFSHVLIPQAPAAAGFAEALAAVVELARRHDRADHRMEQELTWALTALARDQIRDDNDFLVADPKQARGGIRRSLVQSEIRIDFVQHAASAFAHGARLQIGAGS